MEVARVCVLEERIAFAGDTLCIELISTPVVIYNIDKSTTKPNQTSQSVVIWIAQSLLM